MTELQKLSETLNRRMQRTVRANRETSVDLGRIVEAWRNGARVLDLIPDSLRKTVPCGSYSALSGAHLSAGDRVVVVWVGNEPIVLGRLTGT